MMRINASSSPLCLLLARNLIGKSKTLVAYMGLNNARDAMYRLTTPQR